MNGIWRIKMPEYRLIETSNITSNHFNKLNSTTKYRLLSVAEARRKANYCRGSTSVVFGYCTYMFDSIKGDLQYVMLKSNRVGDRWYVFGHPEYRISVDMVEAYTKIIKYNKDKL